MPNIYTVIRKPVSMEEKEQRYDDAMSDPFTSVRDPNGMRFWHRRSLTIMSVSNA